MRPIAVASPDWLLALLVKFANVGTEIGITLTVNGFLVSGELVSGKTYLESIGAQLRGAFEDGLPGAAGAVIEEQLKKISDEFYGDESEKGAEEANGDVEAAVNTERPVGYVHLRNARFFHNSGTPMPGNQGVWWRGRIGEVSGFVLGSLS